MTSARDFEGLGALVTGGASGIGAAVAETAAGARRPGRRTGPRDRRTHPPGHPRAHGRRHRRHAVREAVDAAAAEFGALHTVVSNAGIGAIGTVADNADDEWRRVLDVNVLGMVRTARHALPHLRRSAADRPGLVSVTHTCSIAATAGLPQRALYSASKGAVLSLTLAMAADHVREGIRVNCVNPGTADTPWVGRLLDQAAGPGGRARRPRSPPAHGTAGQRGRGRRCRRLSREPGGGRRHGHGLAVDGGMQGLRLRPAT